MLKLILKTLTSSGISLMALILAFSPLIQSVPVTAAATTPTVSFVKDQVIVTEGTTAYLRIKLDQPVTETTKVTVEFDPEDGTSKSDVSFRDTVTLTYRAGGLTTKSISLRTIRTAAEGNKGLVATITKVNNIEVDGDSAEVTILDQNPTVAGLRNTNPTVNLPSPTNNTPTKCLDLTTNQVMGLNDETDANGPVRKLQNFLYPKYLTEPATGYFGVLTKTAVIKFQTDFGITPAEGYVGAITRAKIKELTCGQKSASATPATTVAAYNPNTAWWLNPAPTPTGTGSVNNPVATTNNNTTTTPPVAVGTHAPLVDINASPSDVRLDANGWPKYLNVPADCPAADRSKFYIHHWKGIAVPGNAAPRVSYESGNRFFAARGYINIASDEVFAIPFFVPHGISGLSSELRIGAMGDSFGGEITQYPEAGPTQSVSRCPGQFGSEGSASILGAVSPIEEGIKVYGRYDYMQPGRWYFFNMADTRGLCEDAVSQQEAGIRSLGSGAGGGLVPGGGLVSPSGTGGSSFNDPGLRYVATYNERGKPVCSLLDPAYWGGSLPAHIAPWTSNHGGGVAGSNGKMYFPPNYKSDTEPRSAIPATYRTVTKCYDATKRLPVAEMIKEYSLGSVPRQIKALGTSWNTYACETETVGITQNCPTLSASARARGITAPPCRDISKPVPVEKWVCAAHREGQTRRLVLTNTSNQPVYLDAPFAVEECKWNEDRKAYAWYATYAPNYIGTEGTPNWGTYAHWFEGGTPIR